MNHAARPAAVPGTRGPGRYIVVDGGEGVGKTIQVQHLAERLTRAGLHVEIVREPGGDPFAEAGRALLLGPLPREPVTEVLMFNALRAQVLLSRVAPSVQAGRWVLADRSHLSTVAYQGYGHGLDLEWTRSVCEMVTSRCPADLEIVLDLPVEVGLARRAARGTTDRFEELDVEFHERVRTGYLAEAALRGLAVLDASGSIPEVADELWKLVTEGHDVAEPE